VIDGAIIAAVALLTGFVLGRVPGRRGPSERIEPVCGCDHHHSFHDPKTGACHARVSIGIWDYEQCTCRRYSGPEPLPDFYAPEITAAGQP
jgi:hypothetical protein